MSSNRANSFLSQVIGPIGASALQKAMDRSPELRAALLPRVVLSWVGLVAPKGWDGAIPGIKDAKVRFETTVAKSEGMEAVYAGELEVEDKKYRFQNASVYQLAAAVALAVGANPVKLKGKVKDSELVSLGKSIDTLVKAKVLQDLMKADLPGTSAKPKAPVAATAPTAPLAPKVGAAPAAPPLPTLPTAPVTLGGAKAVKPKIKPLFPKSKVAAPKPSAPTLAVGKSELDNKCALCGDKQFERHSDRHTFVGCKCLNSLAKHVKTVINPVTQGVILTLKGWSEDDVEGLRAILSKGI